MHEGGWRISAAVDGSFLFHPPVGNPLAPVPPREPIGNAVAWLRNWAEANDLRLGPETNRPRWDGESPDYELAVSDLLAADAEDCPVPVCIHMRPTYP